MLYFTDPSSCPCVRMEPIIKALQKEGRRVTEIDVGSNEALATQFGVRETPTYIITKDGVPVRRILGLREKWNLESELRLVEDA